MSRPTNRTPSRSRSPSRRSIQYPGVLSGRTRIPGQLCIGPPDVERSNRMWRRIRICSDGRQVRNRIGQKRRRHSGDAPGFSHGPLNLVAIRTGTIADEDGPCPLRVLNTWWGLATTGASTSLSPSHSAAYTSPRRVDPRGDPITCRIMQCDSRERIQRRHAHQRLPCRKCQPLHRRNADAQAGERTRSRCDGERVDISQLHIDVLEEHDQVKRQSSGGR